MAKNNMKYNKTKQKVSKSLTLFELRFQTCKKLNRVSSKAHMNKPSFLFFVNQHIYPILPIYRNQSQRYKDKAKI